MGAIRIFFVGLLIFSLSLASCERQTEYGVNMEYGSIFYNDGNKNTPVDKSNISFDKNGGTVELHLFAPYYNSHYPLFAVREYEKGDLKPIVSSWMTAEVIDETEQDYQTDGGVCKGTVSTVRITADANLSRSDRAETIAIIADHLLGVYVARITITQEN